MLILALFIVRDDLRTGTLNFFLAAKPCDFQFRSKKFRITITDVALYLLLGSSR